MIEETEEYNRGSAENPMSDEELRAKFDDNAGGYLSKTQRDALAAAIERLELVSDARAILERAMPS